tara:strand:+ start:499 stop:780 length:282 start_codon:yes stop_codon:yes gene_type:complete
MKITKRQLRRIIREEKSKILREGRYSSTGIDAVDVMHNGLEELMDEVLAVLSVEELEYIANYHTGSDFDEATRSLARIRLGQIASEGSHTRGM